MQIILVNVGASNQSNKYRIQYETHKEFMRYIVVQYKNLY